MTVYPDYYPKFQCIASACKHSCCVGWEIDVDADKLKLYKQLRGPMGRRMHRSISMEGRPHFRLGAGERCPFLNEENLCDLILYRGEGMLCQICRDHPRFRTFLDSRTEIGLGLCCEEAARLVLTGRGPIRLLTEEASEPVSESESELLALRDRLFAVLWDASVPLEARMEKILRLAGAKLPDKSPAEWAEFYLGLERLDESWTPLLEKLAVCKEAPGSVEGEAYARLLHYFLFRHFLSVGEKGAAFAALSTRFLFWLDKLDGEGMEARIDHARMYSAEIEYSAENMKRLIESL